MSDVAYFWELAERYHRLAHVYNERGIRKRLVALAEEFDAKARELRRLARLRYASPSHKLN